MDNPYIMKIYDLYIDEEKDRLYLVCELCTGGELYYKIEDYEKRNKQFTAEEIVNITK